MNQYDIEFEKKISIIAYITNRLKQIREVDLIFLFKILYFAEKEHLKNYGRTIVDDDYIAMGNGPVPSFIYDCIKGTRGDGTKYTKFQKFYDSFVVKNKYYIDSKIQPDMDYISKSDQECIDKSIEKYGKWSSDDLSEESHDEAWHNSAPDNAMSLEKIAKAAGADPKLITYILKTNDLLHSTLR